MPRPPALSPAQKRTVRRWVAAGKSINDMAAEAARLGWAAKRTAIAGCAATVRGQTPATEQAPSDHAALEDLRARVENLEAALAPPPSDLPPVERKAALQRALAAVVGRLENPTTDPRAVADLSRTVAVLGEAIRDLERAEEGDDFPPGF